MMGIRTIVRGLAVGLTLAACSSEPTGTSRDQLLAGIARSFVPKGQGSAGARSINDLSRAAIAGVDFPLLLVLIPEGDVATTVIEVGRNGRFVTWSAADGGTLTFEGPVLFSTRGVGDDLLSAETAPTVAALSGRGPRIYTRQMRHFDGSGGILLRTFQCRMEDRGNARIVVLERAHATRVYRETCDSTDGTRFANTYWIGDGTAWQSEQWMGTRHGMVTTQRLVK